MVESGEDGSLVHSCLILQTETEVHGREITCSKGIKQAGGGKAFYLGGTEQRQLRLEYDHCSGVNS